MLSEAERAQTTSVLNPTQYSGCFPLMVRFKSEPLSDLSLFQHWWQSESYLKSASVVAFLFRRECSADQRPALTSHIVDFNTMKHNTTGFKVSARVKPQRPVKHETTANQEAGQEKKEVKTQRVKMDIRNGEKLAYLCQKCMVNKGTEISLQWMNHAVAVCNSQID